jgi:hypothetical protein
MRYAVAALASVLTIIAGIMLAGAGHGWTVGGLGCFAFAPIAFFASTNALSPSPSRSTAVMTISIGLAVCLLVAVFTLTEGAEYFFRFFRVNGIAGALVALFAVLIWSLPSSFAFLRARSRAQLGT